MWAVNSATVHSNSLVLLAPMHSDASSTQIMLLPTLIGPILWGHSGPHCHVLSLLSSSSSWTSMCRRRATVATPGEWQCKTGGVRRLAVANGPSIFQMLFVTCNLTIIPSRPTCKTTCINRKLHLAT